MDTFTFNFTGRVARDPSPFTTQNGRTGISIWVEVPLSSSATRYVQVKAWGNLADHAATSLRLNDRVTVKARDFGADHWTPEADGKNEIRSWIKVTAAEISISLLHDTVITGAAARKAQAGLASDQVDLPAAEQADLSVLAGVTANAA